MENVFFTVSSGTHKFLRVYVTTYESSNIIFLPMFGDTSSHWFKHIICCMIIERFWVQASCWQFNCEHFVSINRGIQVGWVADILSSLDSGHLVLTCFHKLVCTDDVLKFHKVSLRSFRNPSPILNTLS